MGRRFIVLACSNYPLCDKTSGRWDNLLKPPSNIPHTWYGLIYRLLSRPLENHKQYEVTIGVT
jgi:ssDNA-binding Zn-finger/Zn-ribbon topoisomerase 1